MWTHAGAGAELAARVWPDPQTQAAALLNTLHPSLRCAVGDERSG